MSPSVPGANVVLAAEYADTGARLNDFCPKASALEFDAILGPQAGRDQGVLPGFPALLI